ncbi:Histidine phosphatase superfamily, clade-1 [Ascosphaera apis ARSEF 7405]|uniref:Histidine phosphatase superfamily, clade-1 n=1 Tax=Ascosphaera apis ARSEF 7405 TaxID=392613 RepID=A0A167XZ00_9EURO|nr:Histidine phosphatase superfamily, clade-1 [Ascosphaera apis ARSEF 7405]
MPVPRCFVVRHGETEWSLEGKHTSITDLPLTENGKKRIRATGKALVGEDRLIVPNELAHIYVSPRTRAQQTLSLLQLGSTDRLHHDEKVPSREDLHTNAHVEITEAIREWDYGDYEGLTSAQIRELRKEQGLDPKWDIWRYGCPGGERPEDVVKRLDGLIAAIREKYHKPESGESVSGVKHADILIVAHGHILRAFALRWVGKPLSEGAFILEAGGVGTLSYEHHSINEPAILLGGSFVVPEVTQQP